MRFVAMKLRNLKGKKYPSSHNSKSDCEDSSNDDVEQEQEVKQDSDGETWKPSTDGFIKYLADSQLVFNTIERIVDDSNDVACKFYLFIFLLTKKFGIRICAVLLFLFIF